MWPRRQWIIGLIGLVIVSVVSTAETNATDVETETERTLTGIPQIDYIHDPNLPHELKGYDLSEYPFYNGLPKDLLTSNFTCDDRLDGFYASVPHKCQVYHNCLFNQRYDFLCANFTVFDQKNFICHYVSEVDCPNSERHYDRNEELYVTTTTTTQAPTIIYIERGQPPPRRGGGIIRPNNRKRPGPRRPFTRRTTTTEAPVYYDEYYYDEYYDQYYDDYYNDYGTEKTTTTTTTTTQRPRRPNRPHRTRVGGNGPRSRLSGRFNVKNRKRPNINPPVPVDEEVTVERPRASRLQQGPPARQQAIKDTPVDEPPQDIPQDAPSGNRRRRPSHKPRPGARPPKKTTTTTTTTTTESVPGEDYYEYYYDYVDEPSTTTTAAPARPARPSFTRTRPGSGSRGPQNRPERPTTSTTTTTEAPTTEVSRHRVTRPSRVNVRKNPAGSRRTPVEGATPIDDPQEAAPPQETGSQQQRPQRFRPSFPRVKPQNEPTTERRDTVILEEEPPLAPGLELNPEGAVEETSIQSPVRRLDQSGPGRQRSSSRSRGQRHRTTTPDYSDY